jgi:hypothetical protein
MLKPMESLMFVSPVMHAAAVEMIRAQSVRFEPPVPEPKRAPTLFRVRLALAAVLAGAAHMLAPVGSSRTH